MIWIANDSLIKVTNLNVYSPLSIGQGTQIADVAVAADPYRGPLWNDALSLSLQPPIELHSAAANVRMRGGCHFRIATRGESLLSSPYRCAHMPRHDRLRARSRYIVDLHGSLSVMPKFGAYSDRAH